MPKGHPKNGINKGWFKKGVPRLDRMPFEERNFRVECFGCGKVVWKKNNSRNRKTIHRFCSKVCTTKWRCQENKINTTLGFKHSDATKLKISKNNPRFWKGKQIPLEARQKMREAKLGEKSFLYKDGRTLGENKRGYMQRARMKRIALKNKCKDTHSAEDWKDLKRKFNYMCLCCKRYEPEIKLTEDHIIPLSKGGEDGIYNIQPLCLSCNIRKFTKTINYIELIYG